jgi:hypothetical protein
MIINELLLSTRESALWEKHLPARRSVFGSIGYARICERYRRYKPLLFVLMSDAEPICYPMLLRSTDDLPFAGVHRGMWDAGSPEFTGPLGHDGNKPFALTFRERCDAAFDSEGIITEFAHLNPWADNSYLLDASNVYFDREIVWVDVTLSPEVLWRDHFARSCRYSISRAQREGVRIFCGTTKEDIREFHRLYIQTMQRTHAQLSYHLPYKYFEAIRDELAGHARFVLAEYRGQIVSAALYLHDQANVFYYLAGSDESFHNVCPANAIIYDTICWAHAAGKKRLILGGGYKPDDGVFRFKATFSRYLRSFHTYRRVHREDSYAALNKSWRGYYGVCGDNGAFFPSYRCVPESPLPQLNQSAVCEPAPPAQYPHGVSTDSADSEIQNLTTKNSSEEIPQ